MEQEFSQLCLKILNNKTNLADFEAKKNLHIAYACDLSCWTCLCRA